MIRITEDQMILRTGGVALASTARRQDGTWDISTWPVPLGRDHAITALTIAELLARGYPADHPLVATFRRELL